MGQKSEQEHHITESLCTVDKKTLEKRALVKEKLKDFCEPNQNIDDIITSLECYCELRLESLEIK